MTSLHVDRENTRGHSRSQTGAGGSNGRRTISLVKPELQRLSGSGPDAGALIVERDIGAAEIGLDIPVVQSARYLVVVHTGPPVTVEVTTAGRGQRSRFRRGELIFQPAGVPARPCWDAELHVLPAAIDPAFVDRAAGDAPGPPRHKLVPSFHVRDPLLQLISEQLVSEFENQQQPDRFYVESLAHALAAHVLTKYSTKECWSPNGPAPGDRRVRLALDYLHDNLADKPTLAGMAAAAGLSTSQVAALFHAAVGVSPHRYLTQQRVERARHLLRHTQMTIAEVAARTGFADQSHLTRVMRRVAGITPAALRRN
jgi:AraC family transcriptional regulator